MEHDDPERDDHKHPHAARRSSGQRPASYLQERHKRGCRALSIESDKARRRIADGLTKQPDLRDMLGEVGDGRKLDDQEKNSGKGAA
jgi:hypothetical protein